MGKSTAAEMIRRMRIPVFDADKVVHKLLGVDGAAVADVAARFPDSFEGFQINRQKLGRLVFGKPSDLADLEGILHPLVQTERQKFLQANAIRRARVVVLDVPLLFETGGHERCDETFVVSAPKIIQHHRVLARKGMTETKLHGILNRQMPDNEKRQLASAVIPSGLGYRVTYQKLRLAFSNLRK